MVSSRQLQSKLLAPAIVQYSFPQDLADRVLETALANNSWTQSEVVDDETVQPIRTSRDIVLDSLPDVADDVREYVWACVKNYNERFQSGITQLEPFSLLRYSPGGHYVAHADSNWQVYRIASVLVYLNPTEYTGGETVFHLFDVKVKPDAPSVVLFPANFAYEHEAMPVVEGEKIVVVTWMNDLPDGLDQEVMARMVVNG
jgi:predicted 2-oxoglutarate/Fe(II)-dependent dioxygenase YbiX